jgi:hypothetical protein
LSKKYRIAKRKAEQEAETKKIAVDQENNAILSQAAARLKASEDISKAKIVEANAENEISTMRGDIFKSNPELLRYEIEKLRMDALQKAHIVPVNAMNPNPYNFLGVPFQGNAVGNSVVDNNVGNV